MGRRALRKIDPATDLATHLRVLTELVPPFDPQSLFAAPAPLELVALSVGQPALERPWVAKGALKESASKPLTR